MLDQTSELTQVLSDGTNTYLYGLGRIGEQQPDGFVVNLGDALGSVRQLFDSSGAVSLERSYEPYGKVQNSIGNGDTSYGYTGEWTDNTGLVFLRARYYSSDIGQFVTRDIWAGNEYQPISYNKWVYANANPIRFTDPTGRNPLAILLAALVGPVAGAAIGAATAGTFGYFMYPQALAGQCGCEMQQQAIAVGSQWHFAGALALGGSLIGAYAGALAEAGIAVGHVGVIFVGGIGVAISGTDLYHTYNIIKNETGPTPCTIIRALIDVVGFALGTTGLAKGVEAWRASGSLLELREFPSSGAGIIPTLTRETVIGKLDQVIGRYLPQLTEISSEDSAIGFRGSLARGTVGNPAKPTYGQPVNLNDFDIDAFIISDELASRYSNSGFRHGGRIPEIGAIQNEIDSTLRGLPEFQSLRVDEPF